MRAIFWKELSDHFGRRRFGLMLGLVLVGAAWAMFIDKDAIVQGGGTGAFYLDIFTSTFGLDNCRSRSCRSSVSSAPSSASR